MNILLAEDQPVNQQVAVAMLESMGHEVMVANNGVEAVEIIRVKNFDFILMDCQMPEMDGYTAATQIRKMMQAGKIPECPIIALTAHAMAGDREKCLAVGMNGYLTKPLDEKDLQQMISKWIGVKTENKPESVNIKILEKLRDLMGDKFNKLVETYILNAHKTKQDIEFALQHKDNERLAKAIHGLRGSAQQVGAVELAAKLSEAENKVQNNELIEITELNKYINKVNQELSRLIK